MADKPMTDFDATMIAEGQFELAGLDPDEVTHDDIICAYQHLVNTGLAWTLQGFFGRNAKTLIDAGEVYLPENA